MESKPNGSLEFLTLYKKQAYEIMQDDTLSQIDKRNYLHNISKSALNNIYLSAEHYDILFKTLDIYKKTLNV